MASSSKDVFLTADGALYHLGVKAGEIHQRILTVGSRPRAKALASAFLKDVQVYDSSRDFITYSGTFNGTPVSISCIGMGAPNMDFLVREASLFFQGQSMAFIRLGTCGIINEKSPVGTLFISDKHYFQYRNYQYWDGDALAGTAPRQKGAPYALAGPIASDKELCDRLEASLKRQGVEYCRGAGVSAESFYSCQGRHLPDFEDENTGILKGFLDLKIDSCEMESHQLIHLCKERHSSSTTSEVVTRAASICFGIVSRKGEAFITSEKQEECIMVAGRAALESLVSVPL